VKIDESVFEIALPIVAGFGFELVDVEYVKEKNERYLRVFIDKPEGITIDECQMVSEKLSDILDSRDLISDGYIFEVSSPGLERILKKDRDFERYSGELIEIKLYKPQNGSKVIQGILKGYDKNDLYIETDGIQKKYCRNEIAAAKRVFTF
jgi:ribosome maturation factor RimP